MNDGCAPEKKLLDGSSKRTLRYKATILDPASNPGLRKGILMKTRLMTIGEGTYPDSPITPRQPHLTPTT